MKTDLESARSIFLAAVDEAPGDDRARYVESACAGDEILRREVQRLLHAYGDLNSFMGHPAAGPPTVDLRPTEHVGATIGRYKLLEQKAKAAWASSTSPSKASRSAVASR
jgi:hypothetical protein